ncbi:PD-(D/E)XK nuclease-like domain-containing protein [Vagococcus fluvialis]|uniref:PD-(D/E)XK nuclease-like domain-containing protein n=1 Tax=Vagococcus fluvialis TaxID=2738 RepID=UPI001D0AAC33|nr:PD-(D/E)XK nuclease-like domain-containing protein [Vagococcus fluvialis]UDM74962.1 PD-(D/E)XK nuclease-like domain-containing protein [Vagococcus fluvialis]UDM75028.1 PD-(D/E)XK nuclease-like domain-containing protein [Vagococcus fluvialis]
MKLNRENYYSQKSNKEFMSVSQFKDFYKCPALAMAKLDGFNEFSNNTALLVGNYVHSYFESKEAHNEFLEENNEAIHTKKGTKRADFLTAEKMINKLKNDNFFNFIYQGEKEHILQESLFNVPWKARIDCLNVEQGYFVDIKTTASIDKRYWSDKYNRMVSFVENYDYVIQMAIYKVLLEKEFRKEFEPYIVAVSKDEPTNIEAIKFDHDRFDFEYDLVESLLPNFMDIKNGEAEAYGCGKCAYCKQNKQLSKFIEVAELLGD